MTGGVHVVNKRIVHCNKCKKKLFYIPNEYEMGISIECIECGNNGKTKKKKTIRTATAGFAKVRGGKRLDVHPTYFFRSSMEANFARILQMKNMEWQFEERVFTFSNADYKRGPWQYLPDFKIVKGRKGFPSGWYETKGYFRPSDRNKLRRFKKRYPDEAKKLTVVVYSKYKKDDIAFCKKYGFKYMFFDALTDKYKPQIPTWE
jgi:hypothetical protein